MVRFVDEDKMNPVQRALEHARFQLCLLHGATISHENSNSYVADTKPNIALIDEALNWLATTSGPNTAP